MFVEIGLDRRAAVHRALGEPHRLAIVDALALSDRSPSELAELASIGSNLVAFHLGVLEAAGVVERTASQGDGRRRYVRLHRDALGVVAPRRVHADEVLFVCTRNSARSQLAAALWERRTGLRARSAGTDPASAVHPLAFEVAAAHGLDLSSRVPRHRDALEGPAPDLVVSVCDRAREAGGCAPQLHWSVPDPAGGTAADFEAAFRQLADRVEVLAVSRAA